MFMKNRDDERYKCVEMHCQNIDNQGEMSCYQKTHMERNKNPVYRAKKKNRDTQKYIKNDNQETVETNNQTRIYLQEQE
jgi:hypothetical protein